MKLPSMFISVALLVTTLSARTIEQDTTLVDQKSQLQIAVLACNAEQFKDTWSQYQTTAQEQELVTTRTALTQLANQLHAQKTQERTVKLNDKKTRTIAGLRAVFAAIPAAVRTTYLLADYIYQKAKKGKLVLWSKIKKGKILHASSIVLYTVLPILFGNYAVQDINYARFAGTQQLTKDITALDEILACLNQ